MKLTREEHRHQDAPCSVSTPPCSDSSPASPRTRGRSTARLCRAPGAGAAAPAPRPPDPRTSIEPRGLMGFYCIRSYCCLSGEI